MTPRQRQLLQQAIDPPTSDADRADFLHALDDSPTLAGEVNALRQADRLLRRTSAQSGLAHAPETFAVRVMHGLRLGAPARQSMRPSGLALAIALGLVALLIAPAILLLTWTALILLIQAAVSGALFTTLSAIAYALDAALDTLVRAARLLLFTYPYLPALAIVLIAGGAGGLFKAARAVRA